MITSKNFQLAILTLFYSCQSVTNESSTTLSNLKGNSDIMINEISPARAITGTPVTIYGTNLPVSDFEVYFNNTLVDSVIASSSLVLKVIVPETNKNENILVKVSKKESYSNSLPFETYKITGHVPTLYYSQEGIFRSSVKNSKVKTVQISESAYIRGMVIDSLKGVIYHGSYYGPIFKVDTNTGDSEQIVNVGNGLENFIIDKEGRWIYYANKTSILKIPLSGDTTKKEVLYSNLSSPQTVVLGPDGKTLYWCESDAVYIKKGSIDREEAKILWDSNSDLRNPQDMVLDSSNGKLYIVDTPGYGDSKIFEGDLKSGELLELTSTEKGAGEFISSIDMDRENKVLYWMNSKGMNNNHHDDGEIIRWSLKDATPEAQIVVQPINYGDIVRVL